MLAVQEQGQKQSRPALVAWGHLAAGAPPLALALVAWALQGQGQGQQMAMQRHQARQAEGQAWALPGRVAVQGQRVVQGQHQHQAHQAHRAWVP